MNTHFRKCRRVRHFHEVFITPSFFGSKNEWLPELGSNQRPSD
jgi:hypothetical protein